MMGVECAIAGEHTEEAQPKRSQEILPMRLDSDQSVHVAAAVGDGEVSTKDGLANGAGDVCPGPGLPAKQVTVLHPLARGWRRVALRL